MTSSSSRSILPENRGFRIALIAVGIVILFRIYLIGVATNPPGFYVDESALAYNAYQISQTGAGEFGPVLPLYFQIYTGGFTQYSQPTQIYILAAAYKIFGPGIVLSRVVAAAFVFAACLLLGFLAARVSGDARIGTIVGAFAIVTPWLFEVSRLVLETFAYPLVVVLFLWAIFAADKKESWSWLNAGAIAATLALMTYSYTIGRMLGLAFAVGLLLFASSRQRLVSIGKTWLLFAITLVPLFVYRLTHDGLSDRFYAISYIKPQSSLIEIIPKFIARFFQDINPLTMLFHGDPNPRHHIQDALGSFFVVLFILAMIGIVIVVASRLKSGWWRFVLFGTAVAAAPGALTLDVFHTFRMLAYPIFLLVLTVPALEWIVGKSDAIPVRFQVPATARKVILVVIVAVLAVEAIYFHKKFYERGALRGYAFDAAYKPLYDAAVARPDRPIYLVDGYWGPMYVHARWYAVLERRDKSEFVHQPYGVPPPSGAVVLSSEQSCMRCQMIRKEGEFLFYRVP